MKAGEVAVVARAGPTQPVALRDKWTQDRRMSGVRGQDTCVVPLGSWCYGRVSAEPSRTHSLCSYRPQRVGYTKLYPKGLLESRQLDSTDGVYFLFWPGAGTHGMGIWGLGSRHMEVSPFQEIRVQRDGALRTSKGQEGHGGLSLERIQAVKDLGGH